MTAESLDEALARLGSSTPVSTQGRARPVPANGIGGQPLPLDFSAYVPNIRRDPVPVSPPPPLVPTPGRRRDPNVPLAYDAGADALRARIHARLWKGLAQLNPAVPVGILFLGPSGCGKSSAAAYALKRFQATFRPPLHGGNPAKIVWLDALEATDEERRYRLGSGDPNWLTSAEKADWLVLDDVGTGTSPSIVQLVLARRYQTCRPTILTSGLEQKALTEHIGAATVRRVLETGGVKGLLVNCHGVKP